MGNVDGVPFYVMRYQAGGTLGDRIEPVASPEQVQFAPDQFEWLSCVAKALDYLHKEQFFHRDVKPGNILFSAGGAPFLVDFGIAKDLNAMTQPMTMQGAAVGTLAYMAPEVLQGETYTPQADQYGLAATLYESMVGDKPYDGSTPFALFQAWQTNHRKLTEIFSQLPPGASEAIDRALASDPSERFKACSKFASAFVAGLQASSSDGLPIAELNAEDQASAGSEDGTQELDLETYRENASKQRQEIEDPGDKLFPAPQSSLEDSPVGGEGQDFAMCVAAVLILLSGLVASALSMAGMFG